MPVVKSDNARTFIQRAKLPAAPKAGARVRGAPGRNSLDEQPPIELKDKDAQALVVGSSLIAAAENVPADIRQDIINCTLFAQLAASGSVAEESNVGEWYAFYFNALTALGWAQNGTNFREFSSGTMNFETHKAIISVITLALGPQIAAVALITETLNALQSINANSPWITLFDRQSVVSRMARFQVATAQYAGTGLLEIALVAFDLKSKAKLTQVLFFKTKSSELSLKYADGRATIFADVLEQNRASVAVRLDAYRSSYIREVKFPPKPSAAAGDRSRSRRR
jgi:hypothetical protein